MNVDCQSTSFENSGTLYVFLPVHWGRVKSLGLSVQVARGKVKSQEGRERREGIEVHVSTGYWLPGGLEGWGGPSGTTS